MIIGSNNSSSYKNGVEFINIEPAEAGFKKENRAGCGGRGKSEISPALLNARGYLHQIRRFMCVLYFKESSLSILFLKKFVQNQKKLYLVKMLKTAPKSLAR